MGETAGTPEKVSRSGAFGPLGGADARNGASRVGRRYCGSVGSAETTWGCDPPRSSQRELSVRDESSPT